MAFARFLKTTLCAMSLGLIVAGSDVLPQAVEAFIAPGQAEALVGRPLTPLSVAGVARRTTRRVIRRGAYYYATLPPACVRTYVHGYDVYSCGGAYYQYWRGRYVVVTID